MSSPALRLDLDDVGAEQRQLVGAERPRQIPGEIKDADAGEGLGHAPVPQAPPVSR